MTKLVYNPFTHNLDYTSTSGSVTSTEGVSEFVVDSQGGAGYTTIQSAITAAALIATAQTPQTVWIWPGTYTEDIALADNVNLFSTAALSCTIIGNTTYSAGASTPSVTLRGITFQTPGGGGYALQIAGSNGCNFIINDCVFNGTTGDCLSIETIGTNFIIYNSKFHAASTFKTFNFIHGIGYLFSCLSDSTDTPAVMQNLLVFFYDHFGNDAFVLTSNVYCFFKSCFIQSVGTGSLYEIENGSTLEIDTASVTCNAGTGFWASGVSGSYGQINYNMVSPSRGSATEIDPLLTLSDYQMQAGNVSFDGGISGLNTVTQGTVHQVVLGTGTSAISVVSGTGTSGQVLTSNGTGADPTWQTFSGGSGITTVGDVTSGLVAFDGTAGTTLTSTSSAFNLLMAAPGATASGGSMFIQAGAGGSTSGDGGFLTLSAGYPAGTSGNGGSLIIIAGDGSTGGGAGGGVTINAGQGYGAFNGSSVTITAGNSNGTDRIAGDINLTTGVSTGNAVPPRIVLTGTSLQGSSGTTQVSAVSKAIWNVGNVSLSSGVGTNLVYIDPTVTGMAGANIAYTIEATDGTDYQVLNGIVAFVSIYSGGVVSGTTSVLGTEANQTTTGTLSVAWSIIDGGGYGILVCTPTSTGITPTSIKISYNITNNSQSAVVNF